MTTTLGEYLDQGIGLDVSCWCGHSGSMTAGQALATLDAAHTFAQAANRFTCKACGARGHPRVQLRFSISDYYAICRAKGMGLGPGDAVPPRTPGGPS